MNLHKAILAAMDVETRRIVDEESKAAAARVSERVRGLAGQIATRVSSFVKYETLGNETVITVRLPEAVPTPTHSLVEVEIGLNAAIFKLEEWGISTEPKSEVLELLHEADDTLCQYLKDNNIKS